MQDMSQDSTAACDFLLARPVDRWVLAGGGLAWSLERIMHVAQRQRLVGPERSKEKRVISKKPQVP